MKLLCDFGERFVPRVVTVEVVKRGQILNIFRILRNQHLSTNYMESMFKYIKSERKTKFEVDSAF